MGYTAHQSQVVPVPLVENRPKELFMVEKVTSRLGKQSDMLLSVLKEASGRWLTRSDIARMLEKRKLSSYDIAMLEFLQEKGLVEIEHRDNRTPIGYEFVYRITEQALADNTP